MSTLFHRLKHKITHFLWEADPGYQHLRQGSRTLLAAIIALLSCPWAPLYTRVLACFAAGLVCQGIHHLKIQEQKTTFGMSALSLLLYFTVISYVNPYPWAIAIVIVCASFTVFALRSLGPRYALFPLFVWIMGFITSILPSITGIAFIERLGCVTIGCAISFLVYFYVLPPRPLLYFFKNIRYFIILVHTRTLALQKQLQHPFPFKGKEKYYLELRRSLRKYYLHNQEILASFAASGSVQKNQLLSLLSNQYLAGKALFLLQDNLIALSASTLINQENLKKIICQALKDASALTQHIHIRYQELKIELATKTLPYPQSFTDLKTALECSDEDAANLVPLYQLIISLNELRDRLYALATYVSQNSEETVYAQ